MTQSTQKQNQSGNVLFLILIAVALFAALSYAVTSSTRGGGGDANDETNLVNTAAITQYPAGVRTALIRMQISSGVDPEDMEFNPPSDFDDCTDGGVNCVFHPSGGSATYAPAMAEVMADGNQGAWTFNGDFEIENIGLSLDEDTAGNEIIAFLPGVKEGICERINEEVLGSSTVPNTADVAGADNATPGYLRILDDETDFTDIGDIHFGTTSGITNTGAFDGQAFGCFQNDSGDYVYYHVIYES